MQAQPWLSHLKISEVSFFARFLWLDAATRPYYINYSSYTVNAFRVQVEKRFGKCFFSAFSLVSIQFDISRSGCGPHLRLRSYSSQASEGYKLKAELFIFNLLRAAFFSVLQFLAYL